MEKFIYRFITPEAILIAHREKTILARREKGFRGPVGAIRLSVEDTIEAFLDFFDLLGSQAWIYTGMVQYPDLPYGGCYVFRKLDSIAKRVAEVKIEEDKKYEEEDREITAEEYFKIEEDKARERIVVDISRDKNKGNPALLEAPSKIVNEILFRQQKVIHGQEEDIDRKVNVVEQLAAAHELSDEVHARQDMPDKVVRQQLYQQYIAENTNKKAIWQGKETQGFKSWLDENRAEFDPNYKEYKQDTGILALKNEKETPEFKQWFKENKLKNDESGQKIQTN